MFRQTVLTAIRHSTSPPARTSRAAASFLQPSASTSKLAATSCFRYTYATQVKAKADQNEPEIDALDQPATSPDRTRDPLSHDVNSHSTGQGTRDAATVSQSEEAEKQERFSSEEDGHTLMSEQEKEILAKLQGEFPGGTVAVQDVSGGCGTFFAISIESDKFAGLSKIKAHQKVNKILADEVKTWHGMQLKTATPS